MFQIEDVTPDHPPYKFGYTQYVLDRDRGVWLEYIGGPHTEPPEEQRRVFRFYWNGLLMLIEANVYARPNISEPPADGHETKIIRVGYSPWGSLMTKIHNDPLEPEQLKAALPVLAEALLVFGTIYNGSKYPDRVVTANFYKVPIRWTWADFDGAS